MSHVKTVPVLKGLNSGKCWLISHQISFQRHHNVNGDILIYHFKCLLFLLLGHSLTLLERYSYFIKLIQYKKMPQNKML